MTVQVRSSGQQESYGAPADEDDSVADTFHNEMEDDEWEDEPKYDGRIQPGEIRNRYGRKGKPKKEKTIEEMMVDGLTKFVDIPQRDGTSQKMRLIQYFIDTTIAQAFKGNLYQRLRFWEMLGESGVFLQINAKLKPLYDDGISPELEADLQAFRRMFTTNGEDDES